ncbi:MAG: hypothetical protein RQ967_02410 [Candidatus Caldipriscus sp.]|jgi:esterase/lipase|nr:hypothetical protein [Candidatus Caldipriscus sp.]
MSDREILDLWVNITGFEEDWRTIIENLIDELQNLAQEPLREEGEESVEEVLLNVETPEGMIENLQELLEDLEEKIEEAKGGRITEQELSFAFRKASEYIEKAKELLERWIYEEEYGEEEEEEEEE